jgi:hypothetical protein
MSLPVRSAPRNCKRRRVLDKPLGNGSANPGKVSHPKPASQETYCRIVCPRIAGRGESAEVE